MPSISRSRLLGALLLLMAVGIGVFVTAHGPWFSSAFALVTSIAAITSVVQSRRSAWIYAGFATLGLIAMISSKPPTDAAGLLWLVPLGMIAVLGLAFITSQVSVADSLNLAEASILLGTGLVSVLVAVVALLTPLGEIPGQLVSGGFVILALVLLYQLVAKSRGVRS